MIGRYGSTDNLSNYFLKRGKTIVTSLGNCGIQGVGPGRPKGALNKFTDLENAFLEAFEWTGGIDFLTEWGKQPKNRRDFYRLLAKLLPKEVDANVKNADDSFLEALKAIESREKPKS